MKFNWVISGETDAAVKRACIDLEYRLRPRITKFLMSRLDEECCGNFSCFYFDVDLENKNVSISEKTPKDYIDQIRDDFEIEINGLGTSIFSAAS
ncbi:MAG: hypothetical protein AAGL29_02555 [Bacteroidota bacterium]